MKLLLIFFTLAFTLQANSFTKAKLLGSWELSSAKINHSISFGTRIGKKRNEVLTLLFNKTGQLKVLPDNDVYNYEVINGELKIYDTKIYKNGYKVKRKNRYDLFKIIGIVEGCKRVKVVKKKIPGLRSATDLKMCKTEDYPKPTYQESLSKYQY